MKQAELLQQLSPGASLNQLQDYIQKVIALRGFEKESIQELMLLLIEETGELAKAIRKSHTTMSVDIHKLQHYDTVESEAADVLIVLLSICNTLSINLFDALMEKEKANCRRTWQAVNG